MKLLKLLTICLAIFLIFYILKYTKNTKPLQVQNNKITIKYLGKEIFETETADEIDFKNLGYKEDFNLYKQPSKLQNGQYINSNKVFFVQEVFKFNQDDFCVLLNLEKNGDVFPFFAIVKKADMDAYINFNNKSANANQYNGFLRIFLEKNIKIKDIKVIEDNKNEVLFKVDSNLGTNIYKLEKQGNQIISKKIDDCFLNSSLLDVKKIDTDKIKKILAVDKLYIKKNSPVWIYEQTRTDIPEDIDYLENIKIYISTTSDIPEIQIFYIKNNFRDYTPGPSIDGSLVYKGQVKDLKFKNIQGQRFVADYDIEPNPITRTHRYIFEGKINDGKYAIVIHYFVKSKTGKYILEKQKDIDEWHNEVDTKQNFSYLKIYNQNAEKELSSFGDTDFEPNLADLDELISALNF